MCVGELVELTQQVDMRRSNDALFCSGLTVIHPTVFLFEVSDGESCESQDLKDLTEKGVEVNPTTFLCFFH